MKKLFPLSLVYCYAIAALTLTACGSDDNDDNTPTTSYWKATDLYGRWANPQFPDDYFVIFSAPDNIQLQNNTGLHNGTFKASSDADGRSMNVRFNDSSDKTYTWYSFEWLTDDHRQMKLNGQQYIKQ